MSTLEPRTVFDGFATLAGGIDSGRAPSLLTREQVSFAINTTFRPGVAQCRPGWRKVNLDFLGADGLVDATLQANFEDGRFQGASGYSTSTSGLILASIGGRIFKINPSLEQVEDLSALTGETNSPNQPHAWFVQADKYLVIQDGQAVAFIFNGALLRRSNSTFLGGDEIPTGTIMEYNNGRIWLVLEDQQSFIAGDLAYSVTSDVSDVLKFTENQFLNGGGKFTVPASIGPITAMRSVATQDSTTGQGPLQVFTGSGAFSINAPFDRTQWQNSTSPIQTLSLLSPGPRSQFGAVNVNGDIWYRATDGIRSFVIARRDHGTWVNAPFSREVDRVLKRDTLHLLEYGSAVLFDNRLLQTVSPYLAQETDGTAHGVAHRGLVALDFKGISSMAQRSAPVWEGLWTGLQILQLVTVEISGVPHCYAFVLNSSNEIELWELTREDQFDSLDNPITWTLETRSMGFDSDTGLGSIWNLKQLQRADIWIDRLAGTVEFDLDYRPDSYWSWEDWHTWSKCSTWTICTPSCIPAAFPNEQYRPRMMMPQPGNDCETVTTKPFRHGFEFQTRLSISGFCRLTRMKFVAQELVEPVAVRCPSSETCASQAGCKDSPFSYVTQE